MTRSAVVADLHRLANQLESGGSLSYGSGSIDVPDHVERELGIDQTTDGSALKLEFKLNGLRADYSVWS